MTVLEITDLRFSYHTKEILSGVDFRVSEPGLTCILGPNGVGKTTLVKCIDKLLSSGSGTIAIDGRDVSSMSQAELAQKVAFIPNNSFSTFSISVSEAVMMGRFPISGWSTSSDDLDAVEEAIALMGLQDLADRDIRELSAGQRQRVMIARGIVQEPEILILDEPTSNLDVKYQMEVMGFLRKLAREKGIIVLAVCHDLNVTAAYADRIALMSGGRIFADGIPSEVLTTKNISEAYGIETEVFQKDGTVHITMLPPRDDKPIPASRRGTPRGTFSLSAMRRNDRRFLSVFIVVAVLLGSALVVYNIGSGSDSGLLGHSVGEDELPDSSSRLWVYGNANQDDSIDSCDVDYMRAVLAGTKPLTPLCDANADGKFNDSDVTYLKRIIEAQENGKDIINVYYIDDYRQVQKVSWPVKSIAIGYCTGAYMALITGVSSKVVAVDTTISGTGWKDLSVYYQEASVYGGVELGESSYESIISSKADVYVTGYFCKTIDPVTRERLSPFGIDTMVLTTADNVGLRNDYIDRSTAMFGYLLQGDLGRISEYLAWHDSVLESVDEAAEDVTDQKSMMEVHMSSDQTISQAGTYQTAGYDQTNTLHMIEAGAYAAGQHSAYLKDNYAKLDEEMIYGVMKECSKSGGVYFVYNAQDGFRQSVLLSTLMDSEHRFSDAPVDVTYLGIAREAGSTGMYVVEIAFYQNVLYGTGPDYHELFDQFCSKFLSDGTVSLSPQINHFFSIGA